MRTPLILLLTSLAYVTSAFADCGEMTKQLFGIEMGGPRTYMTRLPTGLSLSPVKQDWKFAGMDVIAGSTRNIQFNQVSVYWHKDRVVSVLARAHATTAAALDDIMKTVSSLANLQFAHVAREDRFLLTCKDRLSVAATKTKIVRGGNTPDIPVLILSIEHPLKVDMEKEIRGR